MPKRSRLSKGVGNVRKVRLKSDMPVTWGFSVRRKDGGYFSGKEIEMIAIGEESVVGDTTIDLYYGTKPDADKMRSLLRKKGYKVDKATEVDY